LKLDKDTLKKKKLSCFLLDSKQRKQYKNLLIYMIEYTLNITILNAISSAISKDFLRDQHY